MKNLPILLFLILATVLSAQTPLPILKPEIDPYVPDFSPQGLEELKQMEKRYWEINQRDVPFDQLSEEEKWIYHNYDETKESPFEILGAGCSWYCGGDSIGIRSSSHLPSSRGQFSYVAKNAHDLSFETAWVEGARGDGIGEYLEYRFDNTHPRVTEIIIHNGYVKSEKAWKENGRVKQLKMSMNGRPFAILVLEDTKAAQRFSFEPLGRRKDGKDMYIRFEIKEVYPGAKYEDVAITEIYFNGIDVHCLAGESMITLADYSAKRLDELQKDDEILIFHPNTKQTDKHLVQHILEVEHTAVALLQFENGQTLKITPDHPLFSSEKGWLALQPEKANQYHHYDNIKLLNKGDLITCWNNSNRMVEQTRLKKVTWLHEVTKTFTISKLPAEWSFWANGVLVAGDQVGNY